MKSESNCLQLIERINDVYPKYDTKSNELADILEGKKIGELPLLYRSPRGAVAPGKRFNLREQFYDPDKMLYGQLEEILQMADYARGYPITVRPNFGTIIAPAAFGAEYEVFENEYPWIRKHFDPEDVERLEDYDIAESEIVKRCISYINYYKEILPDWIHIYQPDTQGPFDIAHLLFGNELFYILVDDPDLAHRIMRLATKSYCYLVQLFKEAIGEKKTEMYHGHALACGIYMRNGGTRVSEDTPTLLSPDMIDEFVLPYDQEALAAFGGGFIHFCGKHDYLLQKFAGLPGNRAINLGNPEMYDFNNVMQLIRDTGCVYFGHWPKMNNENHNEYLRRMRNTSTEKRDCLILHCDETNVFDCDSVQ